MWNDNTVMPYGEHKGKFLKDIPDSYLIWYYENAKTKDLFCTYIEENIYNKIKLRKWQ